MALDGGEDEDKSGGEGEDAVRGKGNETGWSERPYSSAVGVAILTLESDPPSLEAELAAICMEGDGSGKEGVGVRSDESRSPSSSSRLSFKSSSCTEEANELLRSALSPLALLMEKSDEHAELEVLDEIADESEPSESARSRVAWSMLVEATLLLAMLPLLLIIGACLLIQDA